MTYLFVYLNQFPSRKTLAKYLSSTSISHNFVDKEHAILMHQRELKLGVKWSYRQSRGFTTITRMTTKYYIYFFSINMTLSTDTSKIYCISFIIDVSKLQLDHTTILRNFTGGHSKLNYKTVYCYL